MPKLRARFRTFARYRDRMAPSARSDVQLDSHVYPGYAVPRHYDLLLAKLIVLGTNRADAIARAIQALGSFEVNGLATTLPFHRKLLVNPCFIEGSIYTRWVETEFTNV